MITQKYFTEKEFKNCNPVCSLQDMKQTTINMLDKQREIAGIPFVLNSAFRTIDHEKKMKRTGTSAHCTGQAVDIRCNNDKNRYLIVNQLFQVGFNRIGISKTFIHADNSKNHSNNVIWLY